MANTGWFKTETFMPYLAGEIGQTIERPSERPAKPRKPIMPKKGEWYWREWIWGSPYKVRIRAEKGYRVLVQYRLLPLIWCMETIEASSLFAPCEERDIPRWYKPWTC